LTVEHAVDPAVGPVLDVLLRHGTPAVRPDDVLRGLTEVGGLPEGISALQRRLAQGRYDEATGAIHDPLGAVDGPTAAGPRPRADVAIARSAEAGVRYSPQDVCE